MKRLQTGVILLDALDIVCISFFAGSSLAYCVRKYRKLKRRRRGADPIIAELKEKSPLTMFSESGKPLKVPSVRGGDIDIDIDRLKIFSLVIRSKRLAFILRAIVTAERKKRMLRLLRYFFLLTNAVLTTNLGLCFAVGGSVTHTQILLLVFPSTLGGFLVGLTTAYPFASAFLPLAILYGRGIEYVPVPDPYAKCKVLCKVAEEFHNKQLAIEMKELKSLAENASDALQLPLDKVPLLCVEEKLSLLERYKLRTVLESAKARKRIQHFSEFIKKFPECAANPEAVYEEIVEKIVE